MLRESSNSDETRRLNDGRPTGQFTGQSRTSFRNKLHFVCL